ncbi:MAG: hypothetical protein U0X91_19945 [Spirosomataceae bacterium]
MNIDFETFKNDITWFIKPTDKVELLDTTLNFGLTDKFQATFPVLTTLIQKSRTLNLTINNQQYRLFSWTKKDNKSFGWLTKIESDETSDIELIDEHEQLLNEIGGIQESYNQPEPSLTNNQNFLFIKSECTKGIGGWDDYYDIMCEEENKPQIDYKDFICFVQEANGDVTLYDKNTKEVFLFAHDHSFDNVEFLENQPEYTFHKINGIKTFVDYVESLATEWTNETI